MKVSEYVEANFTDEQKNVFDFLINAFPEKLRATVVGTTLVENAEVTAVLAMMAYTIGNAREQIFNLENLKDISYLKNSVEEEHSLKESDRIALLLNALDMGSLLLDEKASVEQNLETLDENKEHFLDAYSYIKNRGTLTTLNKVIRNFLLTKLADPTQIPGKVLDINNPLALNYTIEDISGGKLIKVDQTVEDIIDPITQYLDTDYYGIKQDSDLFKMVSMIRPAGIIYTIVIMYKLDMFENLDVPVIGAVHADNVEFSIVSIDTDLEAPVLSGDVFGTCGGGIAPSTYAVVITNNNPEAAIMVYLTDRSTNDFVANEDWIKTYRSHHDFLVGPNESIAVSVQTFTNYDHDRYFYIAAYFEIDSEETAYSSAERLTIPEETIPTLDKPTKEHGIVGVSATGGYTTLSKTNPNAIPVTAEIYWRYTADIGGGEETGNTTINISAHSSGSKTLYNPLSEVADGHFEVVLSATGYDDSGVAVEDVYNVEPTEWRLM